ncbi:MAG: M28 family peptidase [bacterium]|nr:M28 family peptidase [bacterium]
MKKFYLLLFLATVSIFAFSDEIIIFNGEAQNTTTYYDLEAFKIGLSKDNSAKGEIIMKIPFDQGKDYFIALSHDKNRVKNIPEYLFADFESSILLLDRIPSAEERGEWEIFNLNFERPIKETYKYDYNPYLPGKKSFMGEIDSLINIISADSLYEKVAILSGEIPYPQGTYSASRVSVTTWVDSAAVYLKSVMDSMGFDSVYFQNFSFSYGSVYNTKNVVGLKRGTISHDTCIVVGAHYDDYSNNYYIAPGADDNASGSAGVLEAARSLMSVESDYDIYFVLFSGEEFGLYGSEYFVNNYIIPNSMHVLGMVNFDMIGYNPSSTYQYDLYGMTHSLPLKNIFKMMADTFTTLITHIGGSSSGSDHYPFDLAGFKSAFAIEYDFSPVYHSTKDSIHLLNFDFMKELAQTGTATAYYLSQMPLPVTDFSIVDNGDSSVSVSWIKTINNDISSYRIYYKKEGDAFEQFADAPDTNEYNVSSLIPGLLYTFRITPIDTSGIEAFSEATDTVRPSFVPNKISCIDAYGSSSEIRILYNSSKAADFSHYKIYRRIGEGSFFAVDTTSDTTYVDGSLSDSAVYSYYVTAIDFDSNESAPSDTLKTRIVSRVKELLVIDETNNGGTATDGATDAFYDSIMGNFAYEIIDADSIASTSMMEFGLYKRILYIDDDLSANKIDYEDLYDYIEAGGRVALFGWNIGKSLLDNPTTFPAFSESLSDARTLLGIDYYNRNTLYQLEYVSWSINGVSDTARFVEEKLPRGDGNMYYGGVFGLTGSSYPLGLYHSTVGDTAFHMKPIIFAANDTSAVVAAVPLFYMNTADAAELVKNVLGLFGDLSAVCIEDKKRADNSIMINSDMKSVKVLFLGSSAGEALITITDVSGRVVAKKKVFADKETFTADVGQNLKTGVYFVRVKTSDKEILKKVSVLR